MMNITKILTINSCDNCPRLAIKWNEQKRGYTDYACRLLHTKDERDVIPDIKIVPDWCPLEDYPFNLKELNKPWEKDFDNWTVETLELTDFEKGLIESITDILPRHMPIHDWNLPYAEGIILALRREIVKKGGYEIVT